MRRVHGEKNSRGGEAVAAAAAAVGIVINCN